MNNTNLAVRLGSVVVCLLLCAAAPGPVLGEQLELTGNFIQGGLVEGRVEPGAKVRFRGKRVRVSAAGVFLIGFHRDEKPSPSLTIEYADGSSERRTLEIAAREYEIQRIDGLPARKVTPTQEDLVRIRKEGAMVKALRRRDDDRTGFLSGFQWPVSGRISGVYGSQRILNGQPRRPHFGIDIAAPTGTLVVAPADGLVTLAHPDMLFSGGTLILDHGHGLSSGFLHLSEFLVAEGEAVSRGDPIAKVGATGRATGPHLDWRINLFNRRLDPALLVGEMPAADN